MYAAYNWDQEINYVNGLFTYKQLARVGGSLGDIYWHWKLEVCGYINSP